MRPEEYYDLLRKKTWLGQSVQVHHTNFNDVLHYIPEFHRESFGEGDNVNHYLDKIVRLPVRGDKRTIPVSTVSRRYALVQHHEIVKWLEEGVKASKLDLRDLNIELIISEYGERLKLKIKLPGMSFDPGDGYEIDQFIEARNSVDRSCALEFLVTRRRLVCLNGMWITVNDRLRKIHHLDWMNKRNVSAFIKERVSNVSGFKYLISELLKRSITIDEIHEWADDVLKKEWGVQAAARVCHIARSGYDGRVGRARKGTPPHAYLVSSDTEVPGACAPVNNLYHLSQALSWVAERKSSIDDTDSILNNILRLLNRFLN